MNIFYLDRDPRTAVRMHCDKHVVKMTLETAQMLSTAHRCMNIPPDSPAEEKEALRANLDADGILQEAFRHHPMTQWVMETSGNYTWTVALFRHLCYEYYHRFGWRYPREHALYPLVRKFETLPELMEPGQQYDPPQCMPVHVQHEDCVTAYRQYYLECKQPFAKWTMRPAPEWWTSARKPVIKQYQTPGLPEDCYIELDGKRISPLLPSLVHAEAWMLENIPA